MAFSEHQSRDEHIRSARTRSFDSLSLDEHSSSRTRLDMRDPQQHRASAADGLDEAPLVLPDAGRTTALIERVEFDVIEHARPLRTQAMATDDADAAGEPAAPDPAAVAQQVVAEARETARTMLQQAREVIAADRTKAVEQGHAEGYAAGRAEADAETAGLIRTCEQIGVHVMEERERVLAASEADIVELAIAIAHRIVNASLDVDHELVVDACRGAMRKAFQRGSMQVLAHPDDLDLLRDAGPGLAAELGGVDNLDFIEERRIDRGSVVVRTPAGEIDATIAGKADKIEQALREGIEHRRAGRRANDNAA